MARDKNYVSFAFWLIAIVLSAVPCFGLLFVLIFSFVGDNETRKNYFRAALALQLLALAALIGLHAAGLLAVIGRFLADHSDQWPRFLRGE